MNAVLIREGSQIVLAATTNIELHELQVTETKVINNEPELTLLEGREVGMIRDGFIKKGLMTIEQITEKYGAPVDDSECISVDIWYHWVLTTEEGDRFELWVENLDIAELSEGEEPTIHFALETDEALEAFKRDWSLDEDFYYPSYS